MIRPVDALLADLRRCSSDAWRVGTHDIERICTEAAGTIDALQAEVAELVDLLAAEGREAPDPQFGNETGEESPW